MQFLDIFRILPTCLDQHYLQEHLDRVAALHASLQPPVQGDRLITASSLQGIKVFLWVCSKTQRITINLDVFCIKHTLEKREYQVCRNSFSIETDH